MKYVIKYRPNPSQKEFHNDDASTLLHFSSGMGGGKTHALCKKLMKLSVINKDLHGGLVCPDFKDFKRDVLVEMEQILSDNNIKMKFHNQDHYFSFPWTKGKLYVASAEKKLRGPNWAYAGINEVTLIPLVRYKEVIGRVRHKDAKLAQIVSVGTPEGHASEYYEYFIEKPPKNLRVIYGTTDDNSDNLSSSYIENMENTYDTKMLAAFRKGLWVNMSGNQFYYSYDPARNLNRSITREMFSEFLIALDFNVDPFCASVWGYDGNKIYAVGQIKLEGEQGYSTQNMITALMTRGYNPGNSVIYPDPAGQARSTKGQPDIVVLRAAGYHVEHRSRAPSFRARQLNVNNLLDKGRIIINPDLAPDVRKDFEAVEQDKVTLEKKKTNPKLTHFSDGVDYLCDIIFPFNGDRKSVTESRIR